MKKPALAGLICAAGFSSLFCGGMGRAQTSASVHAAQKDNHDAFGLLVPFACKNPVNGRTYSENAELRSTSGSDTLLDWKAAEALGLGSDDGVTFKGKAAPGWTIAPFSLKRAAYFSLFSTHGLANGIDEDGATIEFVAVTSKRGFLLTGTGTDGRKITVNVKRVLIETKRGFASQHLIIGSEWQHQARAEVTSSPDAPEVVRFGVGKKSKRQKSKPE